MIFNKLKTGGIFYMVEFHPIVWMFDYKSGKAKIKYPYNGREAIYEEYKGTYADTTSDMISKEYGWNHGLGEVVNALIKAGLVIEYLNEYDESPYDVFPDLVRTNTGHVQNERSLFPMIFEIIATKPL